MVSVLLHFHAGNLYPYHSTTNKRINFNAGVMVLTPDKAVYEDMLEKRVKLGSYNGVSARVRSIEFTYRQNSGA